MTHNYEINNHVYFLFWSITNSARGREFVFSGWIESALMLLFRQFFSQSQLRAMLRLLWWRADPGNSHESKNSDVRDLNWKPRLRKICEWDEGWVNSLNVEIIAGPRSPRQRPVMTPSRSMKSSRIVAWYLDTLIWAWPRVWQILHTYSTLDAGLQDETGIW